MKKSKILMIVGSFLLLGLFVFPLWNITLEAPQYPIPLGMDIHIDKFVGANDEFDIKNINLMNHYVGMKYIPEQIPEFKIFPAVIGFMMLLGIVIGFKGNYKFFLAWFVLMTILGIAGMCDFYIWEYDYGHDLDPNAIMKFTNPDGSVMGFQPPLWGSKKILNFVAHSYPRAGAVFMFIGMSFTLLAFGLGYKETNKNIIFS